eukprot:TRINITY_DN6875_c0_g1_i6.p1 TRINITY_DN6875_c0_g1~~TRINITY_DN6875_c0_g1_i6.p1  ORF type:complete len:543 (+),score=46.68 TRINITY_DN6875_c0_g1_i6:468-2096(+)
MCRYTADGQKCPFGNSCIFAHTQSELRECLKSFKYKSVQCAHFHGDACYCPFGGRCDYIHEKQSQPKKVVSKAGKKPQDEVESRKTSRVLFLPDKIDLEDGCDSSVDGSEFESCDSKSVTSGETISLSGRSTPLTVGSEWDPSLGMLIQPRNPTIDTAFDSDGHLRQQSQFQPPAVPPSRALKIGSEWNPALCVLVKPDSETLSPGDDDSAYSDSNSWLEDFEEDSDYGVSEAGTYLGSDESTCDEILNTGRSGLTTQDDCFFDDVFNQISYIDLDSTTPTRVHRVLGVLTSQQPRCEELPHLCCDDLSPSSIGSEWSELGSLSPILAGLEAGAILHTADPQTVMDHKSQRPRKRRADLEWSTHRFLGDFALSTPVLAPPLPLSSDPRQSFLGDQSATSLHSMTSNAWQPSLRSAFCLPKAPPSVPAFGSCTQSALQQPPPPPPPLHFGSVLVAPQVGHSGDQPSLQWPNFFDTIPMCTGTAEIDLDQYTASCLQMIQTESDLVQEANSFDLNLEECLSEGLKGVKDLAFWEQRQFPSMFAL